ncbi:MAG: UbiA family prenyltransferase [Lentilitoribacter sp.]
MSANILKSDQIPLVVDLDGTLVDTDLLYELLIGYVKSDPIKGTFSISKFALKGKAAVKREISTKQLSKISIDNLPRSLIISEEMIASYSMILIVSGSDQLVVDKFVEQCEFVDEGFGSDGLTNLVGENKAKFLEEKFPGGFDYIGNSTADIPVWKSARKSFGMNISNRTEDIAQNQGVSLEILGKQPFIVPAIRKEMRLKQWAKNLLVFVPALLAIQTFQPVWALSLLLSFLAFGLVASSTYFLNDILDLESDRKHVKKRSRPIASGRLQIDTALKWMIIFFIIGFGLAIGVNWKFAILLFVYTLISIAYSMYLKSLAIFDVMLLSGLFCLRVFAGAIVIGAIPNVWFILALYFFFLSLALGKRAIEINKLTSNKALAGRGYFIADKLSVQVFGVVAGFMSIVIVTIYLLLSKSTIISNEISAGIVIIALVFWVMRFWLIVSRNEMEYDPVMFAIQDIFSLICLGSIGLIVVTEQLLG